MKLITIFPLMKNEIEHIAPIPLSKAEIGRRYQIITVMAKGAVRQRMLDMGIVPGAHLCVIRFAPLGDPIEIRIRRFLMSLRKEEAQDVLVTDQGEAPHHARGRGRGFGRKRRFNED